MCKFLYGGLLVVNNGFKQMMEVGLCSDCNRNSEIDCMLLDDLDSRTDSGCRWMKELQSVVVVY